MVMENPSPQSVGHEFVRQYYTMLNESPLHLHRFYSNNSSFVHGGIDQPGKETEPVYGQQEIHKQIMQLNFRDCHAKIRQVDSHATMANGVVVQVTGELSNNGQPMRRFMQTFVLAPQEPKRYYVLNDIFRYQDEVFQEEEDGEVQVGAQESETEEERPDISGTPDNIQDHSASPFYDQQTISNGTSHYDEMVTHQSTQPTAALVNQPAIPDSVIAVQQQASLPPHQVYPVEPVTSPPTDVAAELESADSASEGAGLQSPSYEDKPKTPEPEEDNESEILIDSPQQHASEITSNEPKTYANMVSKNPPSGIGLGTGSTTVTTWHATGANKPAAIASSAIPATSPPSSNHVAPNQPTPRNSEPKSELGGGTGFNNMHGSNPQHPRMNNNRSRGNPMRGGYNRGMLHNHNGRDRGWQKEFPDTRGERGSVRSMEDGADGDRRRPPMNYPDNQQVFVGNLPLTMNEGDLKEQFQQYGNVLDQRIFIKPGIQTTPNYGFVAFDDIAAVQRVLEEKPIMYRGEHRLNVEKKAKQSAYPRGGGGDGRVGRGGMGRGMGYGRGGGRGSLNRSDNRDGGGNVRGRGGGGGYNQGPRR